MPDTVACVREESASGSSGIGGRAARPPRRNVAASAIKDLPLGRPLLTANVPSDVETSAAKTSAGDQQVLP